MVIKLEVDMGIESLEYLLCLSAQEYYSECFEAKLKILNQISNSLNKMLADNLIEDFERIMKEKNGTN